MTAFPNSPSDLPQRPTHAPNNNGSNARGLSLGATVGIAIGVALLVIFGAAGAWIFVRRRRRKWGAQRKAQPDIEGTGDTPDEEIAKRVEAEKTAEMPVTEKQGEGAVELDNGVVERVELGAGEDGEKKGVAGTEEMYEMESGMAPVEIGGGKWWLRNWREMESVGKLRPIADRLLSLRPEMQVDTQYEYHALPHADSIRILQLQPSKTQDLELHIKLIDVRLNEYSEFEAVSYVWGSSEFDHQLYTSQGLINITKSLDSVLRGLRLKDGVRNLWTDAVCINQTDMNEKAHQIPLMGQIYATAKCVLAWLGDGGEKFAACNSLLEKAKDFHVGSADLDQQYQRPPQLKIPLAPGSSELKTLNAANLTPDDTHRLESTFQLLLNSGLSDIVTLPWFSRVWIIQEIVVSRRAMLHYGVDTLDWDDFQTVMRLLMGILHLGTACVWTGMELDKFPNKSEMSRAIDIIQLRREYKVMAQPGAFAESLYRQFGHNLLRARRHNCSDDRDRVYGLLSLIGPGAKLSISSYRQGINIIPDYHKTVSEVYTDLARQYTCSDGYADVRIIQDAGLWCRVPTDTEPQLSQRDYLPTWAPEHRPVQLNNYTLPWQSDAFHCTGDIIQRGHPLPNHDKVVGLQVALVDRVETLLVQCDEEAARNGTTNKRDLASLPRAGMVFDAGELIPAALGILMQFDLAPDGKYKATGEDIRVAVLRTLLADCSHPETWKHMTDRFDVRDPVVVLQRFAQFEHYFAQEGSELRKAFEQGATQEHLATLSDTGLNVFMMLLAIAEVLSQTKFAITTSGMLALLPKDADQQDYIVRIGGARVPFVVKMSLQGLDKVRLFELVGPCYVHGVMYDEIQYAQQDKATMWFV